MHGVELYCEPALTTVLLYYRKEERWILAASKLPHTIDSVQRDGKFQQT